MTFVKPSFTENLYITMFQLEAGRPQYYVLVYRLARNIFLSLGYEDKVEAMERMIRTHIEIPLQSDFVSVCAAFDNPRFMFSKRAYTKVGDSIDHREVTRYEIQMRLEYVKNFIYDSVVELSPYIRFTRPQTMIM